MRIKDKHINIRADKALIKLLKDTSKKMKISQSETIHIALLELADLLKQYPEVDYRPDLNGFLLRRNGK